MRVAEFGELFKFIENTERFSEKFASNIFKQLVEGMVYLRD
jgi:hypothetical protein